ncbi:sugar transferase [Candidatus Uhrbacteria bacterium]|nr:sugar transferase [Candidatus Uhrbacteria bacterium]
MNRTDLVFTVLRVPLDFCMLIAAGYAAYFLRFQALTDIRPAIFEIPLAQYTQILLTVSLFFLAVFALTGLYAIGHYKIRNEIQKICIACSTGMMFILVYLFFVSGLFSSRFIVLAAWILSFLFVSMGRMLLRLTETALFKAGVGLHSIAMIGDMARIAPIISEIDHRPSLGFQVVFQCAAWTDETAQSLHAMRLHKKLDEIFLVSPAADYAMLNAILNFANEHHIPFRYSADMFGSKRLEVRTLAGIPLVEVKRTRLEGWGKILKRLFDIVVSCMIIITLLPIFLMIAIAIRLESRGPIFYFNERVGKDERAFFAYKFRSMYIQYCTGKKYDATGKALAYEEQLAQEKSERKGPVYKVLNDPRRTRVGRFLERFSLDELPQLFNVLFGSMSLVGPRPHMPNQVAHYTKHHRALFTIKPGITGMAQIEGRSDLDFEDEARLDMYYIENWSPWIDFIILCKTPLKVLTRKSRV